MVIAKKLVTNTKKTKNKMLEYEGVFEAHISIVPINQEQANIFKSFCEAEGIKAIQIVLARGTTPIQPMSSSMHWGKFSTVKSEVETLVHKIAQLGFEVKRMKIEAAPNNQDIPQTIEDLSRHDSKNYFEHHWKILLEGEPSEKLLALCEEYKAHFSQNAFKEREDGFSEHFLTLRLYEKGLQEAEKVCEDFTEALKAQKVEVLKFITEYCIYDDFVMLDEEWLEITSN